MWAPLRADIILNPLVMSGVSERTIERPICMGQGGTTSLTHEVSILGYTSVRSKNFYIKDYHGRNSDKFMEADFFYPFLNISSNIYRRPIIFSLYKNLERALYVMQFI